MTARPVAMAHILAVNRAMTVAILSRWPAIGPWTMNPLLYTHVRYSAAPFLLPFLPPTFYPLQVLAPPSQQPVCVPFLFVEAGFLDSVLLLSARGPFRPGNDFLVAILTTSNTQLGPLELS